MTIYDIYKGVVPFVCMQWVALILCIFLPEIIMWAPRAFFGPSVG
jgi:TRAP-type mannitol/chloroaromatic compound transport system permease large subunit